MTSREELDPSLCLLQPLLQAIDFVAQALRQAVTEFGKVFANQRHFHQPPGHVHSKQLFHRFSGYIQPVQV